jgi:hypothetical protein
VNRAQALVFFAIVLPAVLLPVAALAAETALVAERQSRLSEATALAATAAALALDTTALRAGAGWTLDAPAARRAAAGALSSADPYAVMDGAVVTSNRVTVSAHEVIRLQLAVFAPRGGVSVHATVAAKLTPGYGSPG